MPCLCSFSMIPIKTKWKKNGSGMSVLLIWLFCFVVDPIAWVYIHGQFLQALPIKPGMRVGSPTPICGIVHSIWLSLTHTASCLRGSHEPVLPPRKEMFVTHRPVSHDYTVQTQKVWLKNSYINSSLSLPFHIFALSLRNPNYSKFIHIERYKCKPLQQHIVITKLSLESSFSYPSLHPLSSSFSSIHTYTLTHAQTVGQWDYEGEGDHLSQSAVMIVYQRLEEWSGSRWWKQAL